MYTNEYNGYGWGYGQGLGDPDPAGLPANQIPVRQAQRIALYEQMIGPFSSQFNAYWSLREGRAVSLAEGNQLAMQAAAGKIPSPIRDPRQISAPPILPAAPSAPTTPTKLGLPPGWTPPEVQTRLMTPAEIAARTRPAIDISTPEKLRQFLARPEARMPAVVPGLPPGAPAPIPMRFLAAGVMPGGLAGLPMPLIIGVGLAAVLILPKLLGKKKGGRRPGARKKGAYRAVA